MKTRAAVLYKIGAPLVIEDLEVPQPKTGQVLVRLLFSGLCRSQLNEMRGLKGKDPYLPHLLGHEGSGQVLEVGKNVTTVKPADYVVLSWIKGKGLEGGSAQYKKGKKIINSGPISTFCEYAIVSENRITKITKRIPLDIAALLGCAISTGAGVIINTLQVEKGATIVVVGVGGVGSGAIMGAAMRRCRTIIAVDIHKSALQLAQKLGANQTFMFHPKVAEEIKQCTSGGVDYAIEASGKAVAMEAAFEVLNNSGVAAICGNISPTEKIYLNPFDLIKGKRLIGSWGGDANPERDFPIYINKYLDGKLPLQKLISKKFRFEEINTALQSLENNIYPGRILIDFSLRNTQ